MNVVFAAKSIRERSGTMGLVLYKDGEVREDQTILVLDDVNENENPDI